MSRLPLKRELAGAALLLVAALLLTLPTARPARAQEPSARAQVLDLINAERRERDLGPLRHNNRLAAAARRHGQDMVRRSYFAHVSLGGNDLRGRVSRTGYLGGASNWMLGENIAWGSGELGTPRSIVDAWMHSPGHKANILRARFDEIGIAIVGGGPRAGVEDATTYVTDFGDR